MMMNQRYLNSKVNDAISNLLLKGLVIITMSFFNRCAVASQDLVKEDSLLIYEESLEIFAIPNAQIKEEVHAILLSDIESYYRFMGNSFKLILTCDTLDGRILDINYHDKTDFINYKARLVDYFESFSFVKCASYPKSGKVSQYWLLIWLDEDSFTFLVEHGYPDE